MAFGGSVGVVIAFSDTLLSLLSLLSYFELDWVISNLNHGWFYDRNPNPLVREGLRILWFGYARGLSIYEFIVLKSVPCRIGGPWLGERKDKGQLEFYCRDYMNRCGFDCLCYCRNAGEENAFGACITTGSCYGKMCLDHGVNEVSDDVLFSYDSSVIHWRGICQSTVKIMWTVVVSILFCMARYAFGIGVADVDSTFKHLDSYYENQLVFPVLEEDIKVWLDWLFACGVAVLYLGGLQLEVLQLGFISAFILSNVPEASGARTGRFEVWAEIKDRAWLCQCYFYSS
ncbi:unnamed protein product [Ilex paraguariensis]|uniref:Uncharacterized protein n=1 Tax=Ilex paraguariensis TaxID=185542 RepID=A0ABC8UH95_9AQUA